MKENAGIWAICAVIFIDMLGFSLIIPLLPGFVSSLGGSGLTLGLVFTSYSLAQFIAAPLLGKFSDRVGRRTLLLVAISGAAVSLVVAGLSSSIWMLLAARILGGLCGGSIGVAHAFLADMTTSQQRTKAMGFAGASIGLAFTVGPALGASLSSLGFAGVCFMGAVLAAMNLGAALKWLPRVSSGHHAYAGNTDSKPIVVSSFLPELWMLSAAACLSMIAFVSMETTLGLLLNERFSFGPAAIGWLLALNGFVMVVVQGGLIAPISRRCGERPVAVTGASLMGLSLAALPQGGITLLVICLCFVAVGQGALSTTLSSIASKAGPQETTGARMGQIQAFSAIGRAAGPLIAGIAYDISANLAFVVAGLFAVIAAGGVLPGRYQSHLAQQDAPKV